MLKPRRLMQRDGFMRIRTMLILFGTLIVLPAWAFAAYVSFQYALSERQTLESSARASARSVASAVDFRLQSMEAALETLALSPSLSHVELSAFHEHAKAFSSAQGLTVALVDPNGAVLLNTRAPFGTTLVPALPEVKVAEAVTTRKTQYSRLFYGTVTGEWLTSIALPVIVDEDVRFVLVVAIPSIGKWSEALLVEELPADWAIALVDDGNVILARAPNPELHVGKPVHPDALAMISAADGGWGTGTTVDGKPVYIAYERTHKAPWMVLVGVPASVIDGALVKALAPVLGGGLMLLAMTISLAWLVGRNFSSQLVAISEAAMAFRAGKTLDGLVPPSHIRELTELKTMMEVASTERSRSETRLRNLLAEKDLLMQEAHHRVKNSLQLVRGILSLQARSAEHPEAKTALMSAANRILTVADVHQHLYQGSSSSEVNVKLYLEGLANDLARSMLDGSRDRAIITRCSDATWPSEKATSLGLIATELMTNAIKYGAGNISITLDVAKDNSSVLTVDDQGEGFPADYKLGQGGGLGSKLIASLVRPEEGSVKIDRQVGHGRVMVKLMAQWRASERQQEAGE